jgi:hypothetical protein
MDEDVLAAVRRFPERRWAIKAMAAWDGDFRQLCADLADAEAALRGWEGSSLPDRERRCAEYSDLVESLAAEIKAALETRAGGS